MEGKIVPYIWTPTCAGGTVSENMSTWTALANGSGVLRHVFLRAAQVGTIFNFYITSPNGNIIYRRNNVTTELNQVPDLPMKGTYTLTIENCSDATSTFEGEFHFEEARG